MERVGATAVTLAVDPQGFLLDYRCWNEDVALALANQAAIQMTDAHWEIVRFIRSYYLRFTHLPNNRQFSAAIRKALGEEKAQTRYLLKLFPDSPLKTACLIAGLPKPPTCL